MKFKSNKYIAYFASSLTLLVLILGSTIAWFQNIAMVGNSEAVKGQSVGAYFKEGQGTKQHPYIIETPRHLYNLAWLQYLGRFNDTTNKDLYESVGDPLSEVYDDYEANKSSYDNKIASYHFKLDDSLKTSGLNMDGWQLPPIGTRDYPFIGNFDGNGVTISNLTTTNDYTTIAKKPGKVTTMESDDNTSNDLEQKANIVGFFGVIGQYNGQSLIDSSGKTLSESYTASTNEVKNFSLTQSTAATISTNTLVGLIAGYVNGKLSNSVVNSSTIDVSSSSNTLNSNVFDDSKFNNISNYATVGYATQKYRGKVLEDNVDAKIAKVTHNVQNGGGAEFNASIDMKSTYEHVKSFWDTSTIAQYPTAETVTIDPDGNTTTEVTARADSPRRTQYIGDTRTTFYYKNNSENYFINGKTTQVASYGFNWRQGNSRFLYLYGSNTFSYGTKTVTTNRISSSTGLLITDNNGNYLRASSTTLIANVNREANTSPDKYCVWELTSQGYLRGTDADSNTTVYLYSNHGTLSLSTSYLNNASYLRKYDNVKNVLHLKDNSYYLDFDNTWKLIQNPNKTGDEYYVLFNSNRGDYYLNATYNSVTKSQTSSTERHLESGGSSGNLTGDYLYILYNDQKYYLSYNDTTLQMSTTSNNKIILTTYNNQQRLYAYYNWRDRVVDMYYDPPELRTSNDNDSIIQVFTEGNYSYDELNVSDVSYLKSETYYNVTSSTSRPNSSYQTNPTYFPLNYSYTDDTKTTINGVSDENTGYIVSGTYYTEQPGDIRISQYSKSDVNNSLGTAARNQSTFNDTANKDIHVVTKTAYDTDNYYVINDSLNTGKSNPASISYSRKDVKTLGLKKYTSSRNGLYTSMLKNSSAIYGLHFMGGTAAISTSHKINIPYAKLADKDRSTLEEDELIYNEYEDYELPEDSIDFHLSKNGIINFFAGTYFTNNNSFFSLHRIFRNESTKKIESIKQIKNIYENVYKVPGENDSSAEKEYKWSNYPYILQYTDNSYSDPYYNSHKGNLLFDTDWITNPSSIIDDAIYYFEIPALKGEYALGSVAKKTGAYLFYLDIGANSVNTDANIIDESITTITKQFEYVIGAIFESNSIFSNEGGSVDLSSSLIKGYENATIIIPSTSSGKICFNLSTINSIETLSIGPPQGGSINGTNNISSHYIKNGVVAKISSTYEGSTSNIKLTENVQSTSKTTYKRTEYDYYESSLELTIWTGEVDSLDAEWDKDDSSKVTTYVKQDLIEFKTFDEDNVALGDGTSTLTKFHYMILEGDSSKLSMQHIYRYVGDWEDNNSSVPIYDFAFSNASNTDIKIIITDISVYDGTTNPTTLYKVRINGVLYNVGDVVTISSNSTYDLVYYPGATKKESD